MTELSIIDYISDTGSMILALQQGEDMISRYQEEMNRARAQIVQMVEEVQAAGARLQEAWDHVKKPCPLQEERQAAVQQKIVDLAGCGDVCTATIDRYCETAQLIAALEGKPVQAAYILHRKEELISQNNGFNYLFDQFAFYATQVVGACDAEIATCESLVNGGPETGIDQDLLLVRYESYVRYNREVMGVLRDRMHFISTIIESVRNDVVGLKVVQAETDVVDRQEAIKQKRYQTKIDDITDYEDLEGQYRHKYDEKGNLIETVEGGDGKNRAAIYAIAIVIALVIIVVGVHYYLTH